jgi:hypothetical protein
MPKICLLWSRQQADPAIDEWDEHGTFTYHGSYVERLDKCLHFRIARKTFESWSCDDTCVPEPHD